MARGLRAVGLWLKSAVFLRRANGSRSSATSPAHAGLSGRSSGYTLRAMGPAKSARVGAAMACGLALTGAFVVHAQEVAVRALGEDRYELTFSSSTILDVEAAQLWLLPRASQVCAGLRPSLGRYRFSKSEPLVGANGEPTSSSLVLVQEVQCSSSVAVAATAGSPSLASEAEAEAVRKEVLAMSLEYFEDISNERYDAAYAVIDEALLSYSTPEAWAERVKSFRSRVGPAVSLKIQRLTIYDNPQGAPEPGLYVAADYVNEWQDAPIHCGYLMWFLRAGAFRITREETGHATAEELSRMPSSEIPALRRQFRCVSE